MARMTDPSAALNSFQEVLATEAMPLQRGAIDPELFLHFDAPTGPRRFTYVHLDRRTVTALVMFAEVPPFNGLPCFQIGYAVPTKYQKQGRAKAIVTAATVELQKGLEENGMPAFYIEAVVSIGNEASMRVAAATISTSPESIVDEYSGQPAFYYRRKVENAAAR